MGIAQAHAQHADAWQSCYICTRSSAYNLSPCYGVQQHGYWPPAVGTMVIKLCT
jgi:hypothetical protein